MYQMPPIIILNGIENENNQNGRFARMSDYCQDHTAHKSQIETNKETTRELKQDIEGMGARISARVKSRVFWSIVGLFVMAMGAMFTKQDKVLDVVNEININQQLTQKDISVIQDHIKDLRGE